jgi:hypothetical protein
VALVFEKKKLIFFRRKLAKNAEICDHNIDPKDSHQNTLTRPQDKKALAAAWAWSHRLRQKIMGSNLARGKCLKDFAHCIAVV